MSSIPVFGQAVVGIMSGNPNPNYFTVSVEKVSTTAALLSYIPPNPAAACTVQVRDANSNLVNDVNTAMFSGADTDTSRSTTTTDPITNRRHLLVGIKSFAPYDVNGNRQSRALAADTTYTYQVTCSGSTATGTVTTENIPLGYTRNDGWPADPTHPGEYAYPDINWNDLTQSVIDPMTAVPGRRIASGGDQASSPANFDNVVDNTNTWSVGTNFRLGGATLNAATISGSTTPLLLREDTLQFCNAQSPNNSAICQLDWFQVKFNASASGSCSGNNCNIQYCLGLGTTCYSATQTQTLTNTPATLTLGSTTVGDLWQGSGVFRPQLNAIDASVYSFTVNTSGTAVQLSSGCNPPSNPLNLKWKSGAGIVITISGTPTPFVIASVQDECNLTLTTSAGTQSGVTATAANFGVLIWKQNTSANTITLTGINSGVGPQYQFGQQGTNGWWADSIITFNPTPNTVAGKSGYMGFIGPDVHWVAADGSVDIDLGQPINTGTGASTPNCGDQQTNLQFDQDPSHPATWYCIQNTSNGDSPPSRGRLYQAIWKAVYTGSFTPVTPGSAMTNVTYTNMTPYPTYDPVSDSNCIAWDTTNLRTFLNTDLGLIGFDGFNPWVPYTFFDGVDEHGYLLIHQYIGSKDYYGGICAYNLGNRNPVGSGAGAMASVGGYSTLSAKWGSWSTIHTGLANFNGWSETANNSPTGSDGFAGGNWTVTLSGSYLTNTVGTGDGQLQTCPTNAIYDGVHHPTLAGNVCSHITTTGDPVFGSGNSHTYTGSNPFQPTQVADAMDIDWTGGCVGSCEVVQIIVRNSSTDLWVYRGYQGTGRSDHTGNPTLEMHAAATGQEAYSGTVGAHTVWDYIDDPTGANANYTTIGPDQNAYNGHLYTSPTPSTRTWFGYNIQTGGIPAIFTATSVSDNQYPTFYGFTGYQGGSTGNGIESHTGNGFTNITYDGGAFNGGDMPTGARQMVSGSSHPWQLVSTGLYKCTMSSGCAVQPDNVTPIMQPFKSLPIFARSGSHLLLDVSGPTSASTFGTIPWTMCYIYAAGECVSGSTSANIGDVYVYLGQAPHWLDCNQPTPDGATPILAQTDICVGLASTMMDQTRQFQAQGDSNGAYMRNLGTSNMFIGWWDVFANHNAAPGELAIAKWMRMAGNYSSSVWLLTAPPIPSTDATDRSTFEPFNVTVPAHAGATGAYIEFGYALFGADKTMASPYCTSRQEACVAAQTSIPSPGNVNPYYFATKDSWSPVSCASGCTIPLPLLPIYSGIFYQIHWTSGGSDVATDSVRQTVTQ